MARRSGKRVAKGRVRRQPTRSTRQKSSAGSSLPARFPNLPTQLTTFIGRQQESAEIKRLLGTTRLLTLTGSGGCGKTRLALQVVAEVVGDHRDGVWLAEFAPLGDPILVPKAVASALSVPEQRGRAVTETLVDVLRSKALLLVLDNCEHLLEACRDLTVELLRMCPQVRILATSREGLGIPGEILWRVPSLSVPQDVRHLPPAEELVLYDAVRLFADRTTATAPRFAVSAENAAAVTRICQRLDGIPLAIELAAARMKVLTVEQIASRLDDRFQLLTGGSQTVLPRHQTLRAAIDWSHNLLSEAERTLFRRLSVFAGGWTVEAAESICSGGGLEIGQILDVLTSLVDNSLVLVATQGGEARYRLLETMRQFAHDQLVTADEESDVRIRHEDWYLNFAERTARELSGPRSGRLVELFETEHDNLRSALEWTRVQRNGAEARLRLVGALYGFWYRAGHWREASEWLASALAGSDAASLPLRTKAFTAAAQFAWRLGDHRRAARLGEQGLVLCRQLGDKEASAWLLTYISVAAMHQGDYDHATALCEEALGIGRELGDKNIISMQLAHLGIVARHVGEYERAATLQTESLAIAREQHDSASIAFVLRNLGKLALRQKDPQRASIYRSESLVLSNESSDKWLSEEALAGLAAVSLAAGDYRRSARLMAAAERLREILGWHPSPPDQADYDECQAAARTALGDAAFAVARTRGQAMTLEQAVEYALASVRSKERAGHPTRDRRPKSDSVTTRELEVVRLVSRGFTNRQIARALVLSRRTVDAHVQNILNKLGFDSRSQIAAWATERSLRGHVDPEAFTYDDDPSHVHRDT